MKSKSDEKARHVLELDEKGVSLEDIAGSSGISSGTVKKILSAVKRGQGSYERYLSTLAKNKGHSSRYDYRKELSDRKSETLRAKMYRLYIFEELHKIGRKPVWLAKKSGLSKAMISNYINGRSLPSRENFERIDHIFRTGYNNLDNLIMDYLVRVIAGSFKK